MTLERSFEALRSRGHGRPGRMLRIQHCSVRSAVSTGTKVRAGKPSNSWVNHSRLSTHRFSLLKSNDTWRPILRSKSGEAIALKKPCSSGQDPPLSHDQHGCEATGRFRKRCRGCMERRLHGSRQQLQRPADFNLTAKTAATAPTKNSLEAPRAAASSRAQKGPRSPS